VPLPTQVNIFVVSGSMWDEGYQLLDDPPDPTPMNITGKTFKLAIRPTVTDAAPSPLITVSSQVATAQGYITVDTGTSSLLVVLSPTATALLGHGARPYTLWMDPGLTTATDLVNGTCYSTLAAAA